MTDQIERARKLQSEAVAWQDRIDRIARTLPDDHARMMSEGLHQFFAHFQKDKDRADQMLASMLRMLGNVVADKAMQLAGHPTLIVPESDPLTRGIELYFSTLLRNAMSDRARWHMQQAASQLKMVGG